MKRSKCLEKLGDCPFLLFLPFLFVYLAIVVVMSGHVHDGDAPRYFFYAQNLVDGYFTDRDCVDIWNGPGYPILLMPIVFFGLPHIFATILNAVFQYLSVVFLYKCVRMVSNVKYAIVCAIFWACYYPVIYVMRVALSESVTNLLIVLLCFFALKAFKESGFRVSAKYLIAAGVTFGALTLTKVIFGYTFPILIAIGLLLFAILKSRRTEILKCLTISALGFVVCIPWLAYTHSVTGKPFFWAASGGENLFWASLKPDAPYAVIPRCKNESFNWDRAVRDFEAPVHPDLQQIVQTANSLSQIDADAYLKKLAVENIKKNPVNYVQKIVMNVSEFLFASRSGKGWYVIAFIIPHAPIFTFAIFALPATLFNIRRINVSILFLLLIASIYCAGSVLLLPLQRQFMIVVPTLLIWFAYIYSRTVKVRLSIESDDENIR